MQLFFSYLFPSLAGFHEKEYFPTLFGDFGWGKFHENPYNNICKDIERGYRVCTIIRFLKSEGCPLYDGLTIIKFSAKAPTETENTPDFYFN